MAQQSLWCQLLIMKRKQSDLDNLFYTDIDLGLIAYNFRTKNTVDSSINQSQTDWMSFVVNITSTFNFPVSNFFQIAVKTMPDKFYVFCRLLHVWQKVKTLLLKPDDLPCLLKQPKIVAHVDLSICCHYCHSLFIFHIQNRKLALLHSFAQFCTSDVDFLFIDRIFKHKTILSLIQMR